MLDSIEDLLVSHPLLRLIKREAKALHRDLKPLGKSLMECQEAIVRARGYNDWHHFRQTLRHLLESPHG